MSCLPSLATLMLIIGLASSTVSAEDLKPEDSILSGEPISLIDVVRFTVVRSPDIIRQRLNVTIAQAGERVQRGAFDPNIYANATLLRNYYSDSPEEFYNEVHERNVLAQTGLSKRFREGFSTTFSVDLLRKDATNNLTVHNKANVLFTVTIPLLKGRGRTSAAADETASRLEKEATLAELHHFIAGILLQAIQGYWDYKGAVENRSLRQRSVQRILRWQEEFKRARGGSKAAASRLEGVLADKRRIVAGAIEQVNLTKSNLALLMGISASQVKNLGPPSSDFLDPEAVLAAFDYQIMKDKWLMEALQKRLDLKALGLRQQASATLVAKAKRDVLPQFDLQLAAGYKGFVEGDEDRTFFESLDSNIPGTDTSAKLMLNYPLGNNVAKATLDINRAIDQQRLIDVHEQERTIHVQIGVDITTLERRLQEVKEAKQTVNAYLESAEDLVQSTKEQIEELLQSTEEEEQEKGSSKPARRLSRRQLEETRKASALIKKQLRDENKIFNLIDIEDKLTEANNDELQAVRELAKIIAQIRFQTGQLISPTKTADAKTEIKLENIISLP